MKPKKKLHNIEKKNLHTNALTFTTFDIAATGAMKLKGGKHQLNVILVRSLVCVCISVCGFFKANERESC